MVKKILALVLQLAISFSAVTYAQPTIDELSNDEVVKHEFLSEKSRQKVDILTECGISLFFNESGNITNGDFAKAILELLNMYNGESSQAAVDKIREFGWIPGDARFLVGADTHIDIAYEICVNALGYKDLAEQVGYREVVSETELNDGIKTTGKIDNENFAMFIFNMFKAPVNKIIFEGSKYKKFEIGERLHEVYHDIYYVKDTLYACEYAALSGYESAIGRRNIYVGNKTIYIDNDEICEYLGCELEVYAKKNAYNELNLICYSPCKTDNVLDLSLSAVISAKGFDSTDSFLERKNPRLIYRTKNNQKTAKLSGSAILLYNSNKCRSIENNDFIGDFGNIRFVDCNDDGLYDIVSIRRYEVYTISGVDRSNMNLMLEGGTKIEAQSVSRFIVRTNGVESTFYDLEQGMIIGVYKNKGLEASSRIEIRIFSNQSDGKVTAISKNKNKIKVDGTEYDCRALVIDTLKLSINYKFVTDDNGVIVYAEKSENDSVYAYYIKHSTDETEEENYFRVIESDGKGHTYKLAKSVIYTGINASGAWVERKRLKYRDMKNVLSAAFGERCLVKIKKNGEFITEIIMPKDMSQNADYKGWTDDEFTMEESYGKIQNKLLISDKSVSRNYRTEYANTLVVLDNVSENEVRVFPYKSNRVNDISLAAYGLIETRIYDSNDRLVASAFVVKHDPNLIGNGIGAGFEIPNEVNRQRFVVKELTQTVNEDNELTYRVTGYLNGNEVSYTAVDANVTQKYTTKYADKDCYKVGELRENDVILVDLDEKGRMSNFYFISRPQ